MLMTLLRLLISCGGLFCLFCLLRRKFQVSGFWLVFYFVFRLVVMGVLIHLCGVPFPSDIAGFFDQASRTLQGDVPNRDFLTPYGFLYNYFLAAGLLIYKSGFSIIVLFTLAESIGVWCFWRAFTKLFSQPVADRAVLFYMFSPVVIQNLWLGAQDESLQILLIGVLVWLMAFRSQWLTMLVSFLGLYFTKIFSVWIVAPFLLICRPRVGVVFLLAIAAASTVFFWADIRLVSLVFERANGNIDKISDFVMSGNVWYLYEFFIGPIPRYLPESLVLFLFAAGTLLGLGTFRTGVRDERLFVSFLAVYYPMCFLLFYPMTFSTYLCSAVPFLGLWVPEKSKWKQIVFYAWCLLYSVENTLCIRVLRQPVAMEFKKYWIVYECFLVGVFLFIWLDFILSARKSGLTFRNGLVGVNEYIRDALGERMYGTGLRLYARYAEFVRYCLIGVSGCTLDFLLFAVLSDGFGIFYQYANFVSVSFGIGNNFLWNAFVNFRVRDRLAIRFLRFYSVGMLGLGVSAALLYVLIEFFGLNRWTAKALTILVVTLVQFTLNRVFTFKTIDREVQ